MSTETCYWCLRTGHPKRNCPDFLSGKPRTRASDFLPVAGPVSVEAPVPALASGQPDWRIEGVNYRPPEQISQDVHGHAEAARRALERNGLLIDRPEYHDRRRRLAALEQLAEAGRISITEYHRRVADIHGIPRIPPAVVAGEVIRDERQSA